MCVRRNNSNTTGKDFGFSFVFLFTYVGLFVELFDIIDPSITGILHSPELEQIPITAS